MVGRAEAQRVQIGDRPRAHGEHVAHDAADAGRRALIGLDIGGVVVALHLEDRRLAVADVDDAGILARAADHLRARRSAVSSARRGGFVGTVLRPHHREHAELRQCGLASKLLQKALIFLRAYAVFGDQLFGESRRCRRHAAARSMEGLHKRRNISWRRRCRTGPGRSAVRGAASCRARCRSRCRCPQYCAHEPLGFAASVDRPVRFAVAEGDAVLAF